MCVCVCVCVFLRLSPPLRCLNFKWCTRRARQKTTTHSFIHSFTRFSSENSAPLQKLSSTKAHAHTHTHTHKHACSNGKGWEWKESGVDIGTFGKWEFGSARHQSPSPPWLALLLFGLGGWCVFVRVVSEGAVGVRLGGARSTRPRCRRRARGGRWFVVVV